MQRLTRSHPRVVCPPRSGVSLWGAVAAPACLWWSGWAPPRARLIQDGCSRSGSSCSTPLQLPAGGGTISPPPPGPGAAAEPPSPARASMGFIGPGIGDHPDRENRAFSGRCLMVRRCRDRHARSHDSRTGVHGTASPAVGPATRSPGHPNGRSGRRYRTAAGARRWAAPGASQHVQQHRSAALQDRPRRPDRRCRCCRDRLSAAAPAPGRHRRRTRAVENRGRGSSHDYRAVPPFLMFSFPVQARAQHHGPRCR
jgi:hypothetical protein